MDLFLRILFWATILLLICSLVISFTYPMFTAIFFIAYSLIALLVNILISKFHRQLNAGIFWALFSLYLCFLIAIPVLLIKLEFMAAARFI